MVMTVVVVATVQVAAALVYLLHAFRSKIHADRRSTHSRDHIRVLAGAELAIGLATERIYRQAWATRPEVRAAVLEYIGGC